MIDIVGHDQILSFFAKAIDNGGLSHAYCFVGQDQLGKKTVAKEIAAKLLETTREKLLMQPDFVLVGREFDEKTSKTKKDISIAQIRDLKDSLSRSSYSGGYKVAIIDEANKMSAEAANALLKTLEEPKKKTVIFLIVKDEAELLPTILSRCQTIYFQAVDADETKQKLLELGIDENLVNKSLELSFGLPGRAIEFTISPEELKMEEAEKKRFLSLFGSAFFEKLKLVEDLFGDKTDAVATRNNLEKVLNLWLAWLRELILNRKCSDEKGLILYQKIDEAKDLLEKNVHPRLLIENILLQIP